MGEIMKPLGNRVFLKKIEKEKESGGIVLQATKQDDAIKCTVEAIGSGVEDLTVGDVVFISKYGGVEANGGLLIKEEDVIGLVV